MFPKLSFPPPFSQEPVEGTGEPDELYVTMEELRSHDGCWVAVHGGVYDVTEYLDLHPGGRGLLENVLGQDASEDYDAMFHGKNAAEHLARLRVGTLREKSERNSRGSRSRRERASLLAVPPRAAASAEAQSSPSSSSSRPKNPILAAAAAAQEKQRNEFHRRWPTVAPAVGPTRLGRPVSRQSEGHHAATLRPLSLEKLKYAAGVGSTDGTRTPPTFSGVVSHNIRHSQDTVLLCLKLPATVPFLSAGQHFKIAAEYSSTLPAQNLTMQARDYTPLWWSDDRDVWFVVKAYPNGRVSPFLSSATIGMSLKMVGPLCHFLPTNLLSTDGRCKYEHLLLIGGGTGIAPLYSILSEFVLDPTTVPAISNDGTPGPTSGARLRNEFEQTNVTVVTANHTPSDVLLREHLNALSAGRLFECKHTVSSNPDQVPGYHVGRFLESNLLAGLVSQKTFAIVCGPPKFSAAVCSHLTELSVENFAYPDL